jgi:hypothetical protein
MGSFEKTFPIGVTKIYPYMRYREPAMHHSGFTGSMDKEKTSQSRVLDRIFDRGSFSEIGYWIKVGRKAENDVVIEFTFHTNRGTAYDTKETFYALCGDVIRISPGSFIEVGTWQFGKQIKLRFRTKN